MSIAKIFSFFYFRRLWRKFYASVILALAPWFMTSSHTRGTKVKVSNIVNLRNIKTDFKFNFVKLNVDKWKSRTTFRYFEYPELILQFQRVTLAP